MKEKWNDFKMSLTDSMTMTRKEFLLTIAVCVLGGIVFGMFFSPRKSMVIGSNNGNNNRGNLSGKDVGKQNEMEDWEDADKKEEEK